jgi:hypothetical protein
MEFKEYKRSQIAELRPVVDHGIEYFKKHGNFTSHMSFKFSISQQDLEAGSPKIGDMIARNPKNHKDQWLVSEKYFKDNFESF